MKLVVNASPIIFLSKIELIDYLPEMVGQLVIPRAVIYEIERYKDEASRWIKHNKKQFAANAGKIPSSISAWDLGPGETEVIQGDYCRWIYQTKLNKQQVTSNK